MARKLSTPGKLFVIGIGPGGEKYLTLAACEALRKAEIVVGYERYLSQIKPFLRDKEVVSAQMTEELKRAREALRLASEGHLVALVSGGDPAIYGMSAPVFEVLAVENFSCAIEIIPGVTAASAAAAKLGAPISTDVAFISLSDRLTPWERIKQRLLAAAEGDFVLAIYNPASRRRQTLLPKAIDLLLSCKSPETPVAIAKNLTREGERLLLTTLSSLKDFLSEVDMATLLLIGNSETTRMGDFLLTPRGYGQKYGLFSGGQEDV